MNDAPSGEGQPPVTTIRNIVNDIRSVLINVVYNSGGLGDHVCRIPATKYLLRRFPTLLIKLVVPDFFVPIAAYVFKGESRLTIESFSASLTAPQDSPYTFHHHDSSHTTLRTHLVDHSFHVIADAIPSMADKNYPDLSSAVTVDKVLPKHYVVLTPGYTSKVRAMQGEVLQAIIDGVLARGFTPVIVGKSENPVFVGDSKELHTQASWPEIDYTSPNLLDFRDQTSLLETAAILAQAEAVIGLDNGLLHLAGCSDVPIVAGYTTVEPWTRLPYRHNELGWGCETVTPSPACRYCQTEANFVFQHDFRNCYYGDTLCLQSMTADKYLLALDRVLDRRSRGAMSAGTKAPPPSP